MTLHAVFSNSSLSAGFVFMESLNQFVAFPSPSIRCAPAFIALPTHASSPHAQVVATDGASSLCLDHDIPIIPLHLTAVQYHPYTVFNFDLNPHTSPFSLFWIASCLLQLFGFFVARRCLPWLALPRYQRAQSWFLTGMSALVLFTGTWTLSRDMQWWIESEVDHLNFQFPFLVSLHKFPNESFVSTFYGAYFVSYLMLDLILGFVYYRSSLDPLSGWFHHLAYIGVVSRASMHQQISTLFAIGTPIEASTILLAAGHIFPRARHDWLFGLVFFGVRIVYPLLILPVLFHHVEMRMAWRVAFCALLMHLYWFQRFVQQQVRRWKAKRQQ